MKSLFTSVPLDLAINLLLPTAANMRLSAKILILILEGINKKISYECRDYELVDEKSLS